MSKPQRQIKISSITCNAHLSIKLNRIDPDNVWNFVAKVIIKDAGFAGQNQTIVLSFKDFALFLDDLKKCDETRTGNASLTSQSPKEFEIEIYNYDGSGHFSLKYFLRKFQSINHFLVEHKLIGEFLLDASSMTAMVAEFIKLIPDLSTILERQKFDPTHWLKPRKINCSNCKNPLILILHSPFYDCFFFYCSDCPRRATVGNNDPIYRQLEVNMLPPTTPESDEEHFVRLTAIVESRLRPCDCGGSFKLTAARRCLKCHYPLAEASEYDDVYWLEEVHPDYVDEQGVSLTREDDIWKID